MSVKIVEKLPADGFLKFRPDQLSIVRKVCNMEDPESIRQAIEILRDWSQKQQYFNKKDYPDAYFEKLLVISKGLLERSKSRLEKICTLRTIWPTHFEVSDADAFTDDFKTYTCVIPPDVTEEGSRVILVKLYDAKHLTTGLFLRFFKYAVALCEYAMTNDYANGYVVIFDYRDVNLVDLLAFTTRHFSLNQQALSLLTDGYGMRLRGIHMLTSSKMVDALMAFLKQLLPKKLADRLNVHIQMDTLYEFIPKKILPLELGGLGPSLKELHEDLMKEIFSMEHKQWMEETRLATIDESKKPKDYFSDDYISISGSFRTLSVD